MENFGVPALPMENFGVPALPMENFISPWHVTHGEMKKSCIPW
jgi:hypothetical protein